MSYGIATDVGEIIYINHEVLFGVLSVDNFTDIITGETVNRYFNKTFRYALNGFDFSDWQTLNLVNLQAIPVTEYNVLAIQFAYERVGSDATGQLEINSYVLTVTNQTLDLRKYDKTIFKDYFAFDDPEVLGWSVNVTEKLYEKGIVPNYILRKQGEDDQDYIDIWYIVTIFNAIIVKFGRTIKDYYYNRNLLIQFLRQRNLFVSDFNSLSDLQYLADNYYDEINKRGTELVFKKKDATINQDADGEVLRLINWIEDDEFLYNLVINKHVGFCLGNSSPLFKGLYVHNSLNKAYEKTESVVDLGLYPLINSGDCAIITDGSVDVLKISGVTDGETAGIGDIDMDKAIVVNSGINYEITFKIKQPVTLSDNITFGVIGFDYEDNVVDLLSVIDGTTENFFFEKQPLIRDDMYFHVRGIIFNKDEPNRTAAQSLLNIGFGQHLVFDESIVKIIPVLILDRGTVAASNDGDLYIYDFQMKPCSTSYSKGFMNVANLIQLWITNRNNSFEIANLELLVRRFLIPYDSWIKTIELTPNEDIVSVVDGDFSMIDYNDGDFN